jgi:hypothetical protein
VLQSCHEDGVTALIIAKQTDSSIPDRLPDKDKAGLSMTGPALSYGCRQIA